MNCEDKIIISLTSYDSRMKLAAKSIYSILKGTYKNIHIVLTLYKDDIKNIPEELKLFIDNDLIEIIEVDANLKSHLKYFYAMQKYKDNYIITIDDDFIYPINFIENLIKHKHKKVIVAARGHILKTSKYDYTSIPIKNKISLNNLGLGAFGIIYPPSCLTLSNDNIKEIEKILHNDDVYLKILELRNEIPTMILNLPANSYTELKTNTDNLRTENWKGRTQTEMNFFSEELNRLLK